MAANSLYARGLSRLTPLFALAAVAAIGTLVAETAHAQPSRAAPWCLEASPGYAHDCNYHTLEQCLVTARGFGGICLRNPYGSARPPKERRDRWGW